MYDSNVTSEFLQLLRSLKKCLNWTQNGEVEFPSLLSSANNLQRNTDKPVPLAAQSKARNFCERSNTGIVGSNPTRGRNVSEFFCVVLFCVGRGLASG
jgi:hypothetical protein